MHSALGEAAFDIHGRTRSLWRLAGKELFGFARDSLGVLLTPGFLVVIVSLLLLGEALPRLGVVPETLVPTPTLVAKAFLEMLLKQRLLEHLGASLLRFSLGFLLAVATAFPLGVLMGWNHFVRRHALPLFQILAPIPPPAWVPTTVILLGVGLSMQLFLIFLGVFYPVLFNTYQGVSETDPRYLASARVFGASEFTLMTHIHIWHALGSVIMGLRIGSAMGLVMLVVAEMYGSHDGLGHLLLESKEYFHLDRMVVCMLLLGCVGWVLNEVLRYLERRLIVWRIDR